MAIELGGSRREGRSRKGRGGLRPDQGELSEGVDGIFGRLILFYTAAYVARGGGGGRCTL